MLLIICCQSLACILAFITKDYNLSEFPRQKITPEIISLFFDVCCWAYFTVAKNGPEEDTAGEYLFLIVTEWVTLVANILSHVSTG